MPPSGSGMAPRAAFVALAVTSIVACRSTSTNVSGPSTKGKCTATVTVSAREFSAEGGTGRIAVDTARDCSWTAQADAAWLTVSPDATQGSGTAEFSVAATADPVPRTASVAIADQKITIAQSAARCRYGLSAVEFSVPAAGGGHDIDVTTSSALCEWTAQTDATWLSFRTPRAFKGSGRVTVEAAPWTGPPRRAEVIVADQKVALTQSSGCAFTVTPASATLPAAGGAAAVSVQTMEGCGWSASNQLPWVSVTAGGSAMGPGTTHFSAAPNSGPARSGTLTIATRPVAVVQQSGCQYAISVNAWTYGPEGGLGWLAITTAPECPWTSTRHVDWMVFTSATSGTGSGLVTFTILPNYGDGRVGTLTVATQTFTAYQLAAWQGN